MQEARHTRIRHQRWNNFKALRRLGRKSTFILLKDSLLNIHDKYFADHQQYPIIRAHVGGDFFKEDYFLAWMDLAEHFNTTQFYSYTKRIDLWVMHMDNIPMNFELNASRGGKFDDLIDIHKLKSAEVVFSVDEATQKGLELDHDDSHAYTPGPSFAHLIHGCQPAGSDASKALSQLKKFLGASSLFDQSGITRRQQGRLVGFAKQLMETTVTRLDGQGLADGLADKRVLASGGHRFLGRRGVACYAVEQRRPNLVGVPG